MGRNEAATQQGYTALIAFLEKNFQLTAAPAAVAAPAEGGL